jgi:peroxiredoxin Q/BCP
MDTVESHRRFKTKYDLPFPLLSDSGGKVCEKYGVLKEKKMYGKTYRGIERSTFVIDEQGKIAHAFRGVKVEGHVRKLLEVLTA